MSDRHPLAIVKERLASPETKDRINQALLGVMPGDGFAELCIIAASDDKLRACNPGTLVAAFVRLASVGLPPGKDLGLVALIPRAGNVNVQIQWQGYKCLMERVPDVRRVRPVLVHELDHFVLEAGTVCHDVDPFDEKRQFHHPDSPAAKASGSTGLRGGYLVIDYDDGRVEHHFVPAHKIHKNRKAAQTQAVWAKWFEEMALKTVIRDAWNRRVITFDPAKVGAAAVAHLGAAESISSSGERPDLVRPSLPADVSSPAAIARGLSTTTTTTQGRDSLPPVVEAIAESLQERRRPEVLPAPTRVAGLATSKQIEALADCDRHWLGRVTGHSIGMLPRQLTVEQADKAIALWEEYLLSRKNGEEPEVTPVPPGM